VESNKFKEEESMKTKALHLLAVMVVGLAFIAKRRVLMKSGRVLFVIAIFFIAAVMVYFCSLRNVEAWERGGRAVEGPRGGEAVEGPRGTAAVEGPRGNVAVGTRFNSLPDSAQSVIVGDRTYYVDDSGVYYLPCDDDDTVFCVAPAPQ
jgi:membrane protein implicated in regulation of membrane protease activity